MRRSRFKPSTAEQHHTPPLTLGLLRLPTNPAGPGPDSSDRKTGTSPGPGPLPYQAVTLGARAALPGPQFPRVLEKGSPPLPRQPGPPRGAARPGRPPARSRARRRAAAGACAGQRGTLTSRARRAAPLYANSLPRPTVRSARVWPAGRGGEGAGQGRSGRGPGLRGGARGTPRRGCSAAFSARKPRPRAFGLRETPASASRAGASAAFLLPRQSQSPASQQPGLICEA